MEEVCQVAPHLLWVAQGFIDKRVGLCIELASSTEALVWLAQGRRGIHEPLPILPLLLRILKVDAIGLEVEHSTIRLRDLLHIDHAPGAQVLQLHVTLPQLIP